MKLSAAILILCASLAALAPAQTVTSKSAPAKKLYDNFNKPFIGTSKWSAQWQCGSPSMECVREIERGQLRLRSRAYGATNSNTGTQFGNSQVNMTNTSVTDISVQVTVRNSSPRDYTTNPGVAHSQVLLSGAYFNGGGGTSADDVQAYLQLDRTAPTSNPPTAEAGGFLYYHGQFFDNVDLGPVDVGEQVTVELLWDQPNHQFLVTLTRPAHHTKVQLSMPYTISDTTAAVAPFRNLGANVYPANCTAASTSADLDVLFDNVMTN
ncbi:MAG TPA: hypothetical protein VGK96_09780 [Candidatus Sulfotelmatobacter sp.]|jgi:hypothetical protein